MRRSKWQVVVLTLFFAAAAFIIGRKELAMQNYPFSVTVVSEGRQEEIACVELAEKYYVFLPGYATAQNTKIHANRVYPVTVDGQQLTDGQSCEMYPENTELPLQVRGTETLKTVTFVRSGGVNTLYLDVPSGDMEYIHREKGNAEAASVRLYTEDGRLEYAGSAGTLKGRGNATWSYTEKKSYSMELLHPADLLCMGSAQNWVLLSNAFDTSHIRNKVAYDTAAAAGLAYSPDSRWVDLYLNGEYAGLYLLTERNEIHPQRVQIPEEYGYLVSQEYRYRLEAQNYPYVETEGGLAFRIHHSMLPQSVLENAWQTVENAVLAEDGVDPVSGKHWQGLIDLDSWAHKYLLEELFANYDAGALSQFYYCDMSQPQPRVFAGPIWDMDNSIGADSWITSNPCSFLANRRHFFSTEDTPLFYGLYQKKLFRDRVVELFISVYRPLFEELISGGLRDYGNRVSRAASADQVRWGIVSGDQVEHMENFLRKRLAFFEDLWINETEYCRVDLTTDGSLWSCYAVKKGSCLTQLPEGQWYDLETDQPFDITQPVVTDKCICRKADQA